MAQSIRSAVAEREAPAEKFDRLKARWYEDRGFSSDWEELAMSPPYQNIVGMGWEALPFLVSELRQGSFDWFWALEAITEHRPALEGKEGDSRATLAAWIDWADQNGY